MDFLNRPPRRRIKGTSGCGIQACLAILAVVTLALTIFGAVGMRSGR